LVQSTKRARIPDGASVRIANPVADPNLLTLIKFPPGKPVPLSGGSPARLPGRLRALAPMVAHHEGPKGNH
jgi:hypothetical protein